MGTGGGYNSDQDGIPSTRLTSVDLQGPWADWHNCQRRCVFRRPAVPPQRSVLVSDAVGGGSSTHSGDDQAAQAERATRRRSEVDAFYATALDWTLLPERCVVIDDQVSRSLSVPWLSVVAVCPG